MRARSWKLEAEAILIWESRPSALRHMTTPAPRLSPFDVPEVRSFCASLRMEPTDSTSMQS
jgi:hypothetical protein